MTSSKKEKQFKTWALIGMVSTIAGLARYLISNSPTSAVQERIQWKPPTSKQITEMMIADGYTPKQYQHSDLKPKEEVKESSPPRQPIYVESKSKACQDTHVTAEECEMLSIKEKFEPQQFPIQLLSGAPGSGNDWLLWLASINKYTWPRREQQWTCSRYTKIFNYTNQQIASIKQIDCLFLKSHEPYALPENDPNIFAARATLLLRHPYDAAFSEFKRRVVEHSEDDRDIKTSSAGLHVSDLYSVKERILNTDFKHYLQKSFEIWLRHAEYWLTSFHRPLHVLIYNSAIQNTSTEIEAMQYFFGYNFNGTNFRRHCCVMADPLNPALKRHPSKVDKYKEIIFDVLRRHPNIENTKLMVKNVHQLLDKKFPNSHYRITRG